MKLFFSFNNNVYQLLKKHYFRIIAKESFENRLLQLERIGIYLYTHFSFVLSDPDLENEIIAIGQTNLKSWESNFQKKEKQKNKKKRILHIATELNNTGGHTKIIKNWSTRDINNRANILITNQKKPLDKLLHKELENNIESIEVLDPKKNHLEKANLILEFIYENDIDLIVLHTHPFDILPVLSFSIENLPPVVYFNHSDHTFCYGIATSDLFLDFRHEGQSYSKKYRNVIHSEKIDLLADTDVDLDIVKDDSRTVFLAMASFYKFKKFEKVNFVEFYAKFLKKHPTILMYIIGVNEAQYKSMTNLKTPENLILLGNVPEPKEYLKKAHYYIESFPVSSILASFDTCKYGAVPIFSYSSALIYKDILKQEFPFIESKSIDNEKEYLEFLETEITNQSYRTENLDKTVDFFLNKNDNKWFENINQKVYTTINKKHQIQNTASLKKVVTNQSLRYSRFTSSLDKFYFTLYIPKKDLFNIRIIFSVVKVMVLRKILTILK